QLVDDAAAKAETDGPQSAGTVRARLEPSRRREKVLEHLRAIELAEQLQALLVVAGIPAERGQGVGRERDEIGDREPPRDILDIGIEAAILVDDEHHGKLF